MLEPYNYDLQGIAALTDWQINNLLFCPRDDDRMPLASGGEYPPGNEQETDYKTLFYDTWMNRGYSLEEVNQKWQQFTEDKSWLKK